MKAHSDKLGSRGFTLLEVMVSVTILAVTIVPMLLLREDSYQKALFTKSLRVAQELAQRQLSAIALEVRTGDGGGNFEDWPDYQFEYKVSLYDFGTGLNDEEEDEYGWYENDPNDSVFADDELQEFGPMVMRHVELKIFYPNYTSEEGEREVNEYIVDTYIPMLMTEEQFEYQGKQDQLQEE